MLDLYAGDLNDIFGQEDQVQHLWLLLSQHGDSLVEEHIKPLTVIAYYDTDNASRHKAMEMLRRILPWEPVFSIEDGKLLVSGIYIGEDKSFRDLYEQFPGCYTYEGVNRQPKGHF
jgi:hypothetical protein